MSAQNFSGKVFSIGTVAAYSARYSALLVYTQLYSPIEWQIENTIIMVYITNIQT